MAPGWWTVAAVALLLGINKNLQMQTVLIASCRAIAVAQGWIDSRRALQQAFVVVLFLATALTAIGLTCTLRQFLKQNVTLATGLALVVVYSFFRAAEMNHVELLGVGRSTSDALWPLEVAGVALMFVGVTKHFVASRSAQAASTIPQ